MEHRGFRGTELDRGPPDQLLDRILVHFPGKMAPFAPGSPAFPAVPVSLRDPPLQFPVPSIKEERSHLDLNLPCREVKDGEDVRMGQVGLLPCQPADSLTHLSVHLGLEGLW